MSFLKIGTVNAVPGKITSGKLILGTFKGKKISIPVFIAAGKKEGPTGFISGGVNGNELNGIQLCQNALESINPKRLSGTIAFFPLMNPSGFEAKTRNVTLDNRDLNRSFVKNPKTISEKMAKTFLEKVVSKVDFGIDCHDSGDKNVLLPHPRVKYHKNNQCSNGCTFEMGKSFGTELIIHRKPEHGMLAKAAEEFFEIPVMTVEIGGGYTIWKNHQKEGLRGIKNVLRDKGMLDGKNILPKKQFVVSLNSRDFLFAKTSGIVIPHVKLEQVVHINQPIAKIHDPFTLKTEILHSKKCGVVFSLQHYAKIEEKNPVASVLGMNYCAKHKKRFAHVKTLNNKKSSSIKIVKNRHLKASLF